MQRTTLFSDGVVHVRISGEMTVADQRAMQQLVARVSHAPLRVLVTLEDFTGWEKSAAWADDPGWPADDGDRVARMALVGDERWRDDALLFVGKGFRDAAIAFFSDDDRAAADAWVRT